MDRDRAGYGARWPPRRRPAIADRPGLAPGFITGLVAVQVNAGFLGALIGGVIAGFAALWLSRLKVGKVVRGLMPVVVIPLFATLFGRGGALGLGQALCATIGGDNRGKVGELLGLKRQELIARLRCLQSAGCALTLADQ